MGELTVRGLDDEVLARLSQRAAEHGRSVEEEVVEIVKMRLLTPMGRTPAEVIESMRQLREESRGMITTSTADILEESRKDRR